MQNEPAVKVANALLAYMQTVEKYRENPSDPVAKGTLDNLHAMLKVFATNIVNAN